VEESRGDNNFERRYANRGSFFVENNKNPNLNQKIQGSSDSDFLGFIDLYVNKLSSNCKKRMDVSK
jgi:hypothetical protein